MHLNSKLIFKNIAVKYIVPNCRGLEIGPAGNPSEYMNLLSGKNIKWDTLDIDMKHIGNAASFDGHIVSKELYNYPLESNLYDLIIAGQVVEHVSDIWRWFDELKRILKSGGRIVIICPVSWPYHEAPIDCWRIYPEGFKAISKKLDLKLIHSSFHSFEAELIPNSTPIYGNVSSFLGDEKLSLFNRIKIIFNSIVNPLPFLNKVKFPISVSYDSIAIFEK